MCSWKKTNNKSGSCSTSLFLMVTNIEEKGTLFWMPIKTLTVLVIFFFVVPQLCYTEVAQVNQCLWLVCVGVTLYFFMCNRFSSKASLYNAAPRRVKIHVCDCFELFLKGVLLTQHQSYYTVKSYVVTDVTL